MAWYNGRFKNTMNDVSAKYNKDVIAVETAFGYTLEDADFEKIILEQMKKKSVVIKLQCKDKQQDCVTLWQLLLV